MIGSCRGDPNNGRTVEARRPKPGFPSCGHPGRKCRRRLAEITIALLFAANRFIVARPTTTCGPTQVYAGGKIPYQRYRAPGSSPAALPGIIGLGAVVRAPGRTQVGASRDFGLRGALVRSVQPRCHAPHAGRAPGRLLARVRRRLDATRMGPRRGKPNGSWTRRSSPAMKPGSIYINSGTPRCWHDTDALVESLLVGSPPWGAGLDHFRR